MSIQINFNAGAGISFNSQIHSYTQLMEQNRSELCQETNKMEKKNEEGTNVAPDILKQETLNLVQMVNDKEEIMSEITQEKSQENVPPILRVIDRDEAKTFTEYVISRPTRFAHKCEEVMMGTCVAAILSGIGAIGIIYHSDIIPSHNQIALGFVCATGVCLLGTVLSGVAGGISDCWQERKNRLMQEKMEHTRD